MPVNTFIIVKAVVKSLNQKQEIAVCIVPMGVLSAHQLKAELPAAFDQTDIRMKVQLK